MSSDIVFPNMQLFFFNLVFDLLFDIIFDLNAKQVARKIVEAISKKSFGPISALGPRFKSSTYLSMPAG